MGDDSSKGSLPADSFKKLSDFEAGEDEGEAGTEEPVAKENPDFEAGEDREGAGTGEVEATEIKGVEQEPEVKNSSDSYAGEDRVEAGTGKIEASKIKDFEQEPEVIDWNALNESDVDDHVSPNVRFPSAEVEDAKGFAGDGSVESDGLQKESGTSNAEFEPKASAAEAEEKEAPKVEAEADLPGESAVVDSNNKPTLQYTGVNGEEHRGLEETSGRFDGSGNSGATEQADVEQTGTVDHAKIVDDAKEVDVNKGEVVAELEQPRGTEEESGQAEDSGNLGAIEQTDFEQAGTVDDEVDANTKVDDAKDVDVSRGEVVEEIEQSIVGRDFAGIEEEIPSGNANYEENFEVEQQSPAEVVVDSEAVEAPSREFEVEGKTDKTDDSPEQASARAENSVVSGEGALESEALGAQDVPEGLAVGREPSTTRDSDPNDSEKVKPQLPGGLSRGEEIGGESPAVEAAGDTSAIGDSRVGDISATGEDSVPENASLVPAVEDSKKEESIDLPVLEKTDDVLSREEESVDEKPSSVPLEKTVDVSSSKGEESVDEKPSSVAATPVLGKTDDVSSKEKESVDDKPSSVAATVESSTASTTPGNEATSPLGGAGPSLPARPAGLGRSVPSLEHAPRAVQRSSAAPASIRQASATDEENGSSTDVSEGSDDAREKLQMIRVKFLRLANRLGQSAHNVVVAQVLYRLGLAEQLRGGRGTGRTGAFSFERASALAEEQEATGTDDLDFGCTIMVLGKSGVGKSATINSLFDEVKSGTNAYSPATNKVQEIIGTVHGIKLRVVDTPGLLTSFADQRRNEKIMSSVKRFIKKSPPDIVLYFDRLDLQSRDYGDLPLLRTITDTFGSAVWFNAIVVLTHASSAPPDGANGVPVSYEMFVAQRSHVVQQTIRQAAGDVRLMNPVSLVENHAACRRNRAGERVLPNGQVWKPQLLLLCFASKILAEANSLLKLQDNSPAKPFGVRSRVPPLPFLLSSLLQSRAQLKLPDEQMGSDDESEDELAEEADSEGEEEYDDLPPFRRLTKDELKLLDKEQRKVYAEELEYREKLFLKKQLKDERARKKEFKRRMAALPKEAAQFTEEILEDENASASVPVPMPDMALPPSFDSDNPTYRYRYLDNANQWLVRPVLETHGWDHDCGYDHLNVEKMFIVSKKIPVSVSGQVTKDKKEANLQMESAASFKNGEGKFTQTGLDIQTIGKDLAYTLRSETRFDNFKRNKTTCGLAVTLLGDTVAAGMKIEDRLLIGKRVKLVFNGGALTGRGDVAYGGSLEATIRDKDYPIGQFLSTFGLSVMDWHGDLAIGGNLQVQCKLGKTMTIVRGNLNNRKAGQISIRVSNSEQVQIALIGLIPLLRTFINNRILSSN